MEEKMPKEQDKFCGATNIRMSTIRQQNKAMQQMQAEMEERERQHAKRLDKQWDTHGEKMLEIAKKLNSKRMETSLKVIFGKRYHKSKCLKKYHREPDCRRSGPRRTIEKGDRTRKGIGQQQPSHRSGIKRQRLSNDHCLTQPQD